MIIKNAEFTGPYFQKGQNILFVLEVLFGSSFDSYRYTCIRSCIRSVRRRIEQSGWI